MLDSLFDKRESVTDITKAPFISHCYLKASFQGFSARGTATLISESCLVTAGHCLFHQGEFASKASCVLGRREELYIDKSMVETFYIHPKYIESENEDYDIAIMRLKEPLGSKYGAIPLKTLDDHDLKTHVNVTGYPSQKKFSEILFDDSSYTMYTMGGNIKSHSTNKIYYNIDTSGGQSGSGVWLKDDDENIDCVGVHTTGDKIRGNGAVRINKEISETVGEWLSKLGDI